MKHRYRVIQTQADFYEAQYRHAWWPFWFACSSYRCGHGANLCGSLAEAEALCRSHAARWGWSRRQVADLGWL